MAWNTSQLLTMVHLNKKTQVFNPENNCSESALIRWHVLPIYEWLKELSPITATKQSVLLVPGSTWKGSCSIEIVSIRLCPKRFKLGCELQICRLKEETRDELLMNHWNLGPRCTPCSNPCFFSFFTIRTTAVSTERCYCGVGPKGNGVLPSRGSPGDPNAILRWKWVVRWTTGGTIDNTQLRITAIILQLNSWKVTCRRGIVWASDWQSSASCSASSVKQSYSHKRKKKCVERGRVPTRADGLKIGKPKIPFWS